MSHHMKPLPIAFLVCAAAVLGCDSGDPPVPSPTPAAVTAGEPRSHIPRSDVQKMFDELRAKAQWNLDGDLLWSYYFFDSRPDRLKAAQHELEAMGYRVVDLSEMEEDGKKTGAYVMQVEKVETHTVDSLDRRNAEFDAFAAKYGIESYDGMDVGPVPATQPATTSPADAR
jgi:hypothetical protein